VVIPRADGPGEVARFRVRRDGGVLHVTTDSPHAWHLRTGGPGGPLHSSAAGTAEAAFPYA
jgi:alpha-D-xyloside xylohydrolase